jgi:hypothetical protein
MKIVELVKVPHDYKNNMPCGDIKPNIIEDTIFMENGKAVGFYMSKMPASMIKCAEFCNQELRSDRVPKSMMTRSQGVDQYSTILGTVPKKPHMRRLSPRTSSVHQHEAAHNFIKGMMVLCKMSEELIKEVMPEQFEEQVKILEGLDPAHRFGRLFTSNINNYNIAANFHRDAANLKNTVNVIIAKRESSTGGNLYVPDYDACVNSCDNSILVYPAWKNLHGVTPIRPTRKGGYRNTLVFYPLNIKV